jgi:hypothetical protein
VKARRLSSWLLIGVALFVVIGHVCALPVHAHAGAVTTHSEDDGEHGSGEASHGGSCEALRATPSIALPALPAAQLDAELLRPVLAEVAAPAAAPDESPPLFLLHAVLRI